MMSVPQRRQCRKTPLRLGAIAIIATVFARRHDAHEMILILQRGYLWQR
jgi:hypothetical protein